MNHLEFPLFRTGDSLVLCTFEIVRVAVTLRYALHNHETECIMADHKSGLYIYMNDNVEV